MKTALTAREIAELGKAGIAGLSPEEPDRAITSEYRVRERLEAMGVPSEPRTALGGGKLYLLSGLPGPFRQGVTTALIRGDARVLAILGVAPIPAPEVPADPDPAAVPARADGAKPTRKGGGVVRKMGRRELVLAVPDPETLTERQRRVRDARAALLAEVDRLIGLGMGVNKAVAEVVVAAREGRLRADLATLVGVANDRAAEGRNLSDRSIKRWREARGKSGVDALAPQVTAVKDTGIPAWAPFLLTQYQLPSSRSLQDALGQAAFPAGMARPSYGQARAFINRLAPFSRERGRAGPTALLAYRAFVARDTSELWPTAIYIGDGHTFKAHVAHPLTGQPFAPEITTILDVKTRAVVGWSVGIVENSLGVLEALSAAMAPAPGHPGGVPAIFYSDLGKGFKNDLMSSVATGFYARWGIAEKHSIARRSQARGAIERFHQLYHAAAKRLPTYRGRDMDKEALLVVDRANRAAVKDDQPLPYQMAWDEFRTMIAQVITTYNTTPHESLPKVQREDGRLKHQSPLEAWAAGVDATGYKPMVVSGDDVADLNRPYVRRKTRRGVVSVLGNTYFSRDLEAFHNSYVHVGIDVWDASHAWVRSEGDGRLLARAEFAGNARPYMPIEEVVQARSLGEQIAATRTAGRLKRNDDKREDILAEARPQLTLVAGRDTQDSLSVASLTEEQRADGARLFRETEARGAARAARSDDFGVGKMEISSPAPPPELPITKWDDARPATFDDDVSLARWLAEHPDAVQSGDVTWLKQQLPRKTFRTLLQFQDVDLETLERIAC